MAKLWVIKAQICSLLIENLEMNELMNEWMNEWITERVNEWRMNEQTNEWINEELNGPSNTACYKVAAPQPKKEQYYRDCDKDAFFENHP